MESVATRRTPPVARLVVGGLLLLPATLTFAGVFWLPSLRIPPLSLLQYDLLRPPRPAGLANYAWLFGESPLGPAFAQTLVIALVRLVAVVGLPLLAGWLWARQRAHLLLLARCFLSLPLALSSPVALTLLWYAVLVQPGSPAWASVLPPVPSALLLELTYSLALGGSLALTALLLAWHRPGASRAVRGVAVLAGIVAVASTLDDFALPFTASRIAGDGAVLLTFPRLALEIGFLRLKLGWMAAEATLLLVASLVLGAAFAIESERLNLRLAWASPPAQEQRPWPRLLLALPALAMFVLPAVLLYLWGGRIAFAAGGRALSQALATLSPAGRFLGVAIAEGLTIAFQQLPASYLAALSLVLVRPFGERGSRLVFGLFLASGFVPPVVTGLPLFIEMKSLGLVNTIPALVLPLAAGPAGLFIFKLYFAGQRPLYEQARRQGRSAASAFFGDIFLPSLPVGVLAGAVTLLLAGQSLFWSLASVITLKSSPLSTQLLRLAQAGHAAPTSAGAWFLLTCWGAALLLLWLPLQALLLGRLELVAGPEPGTTADPGPAAA